MKQKIVLVCLFAGAFVQAATWTGGGDGSTWGDPANWGGSMPGATDAVQIPLMEEKEINLGAHDRVIGDLTVDGTGKLTLVGTGSLAFQNLTANTDVDFDVPVTLKDGNNTIYNKVKTINFLKPVTAVGTKSVTFDSEDVGTAMTTNFKDTFTGAGTKILMKMGNTGSTAPNVHFYEKLTAAKLSCCEDGYRSGWCYLHASGNEIAAVEICYGGIVLVGENALPETTALEWHNYYKEESENLFAYQFTGTDQVAEAVRCAEVFTGDRTRLRYLRSINGSRTTLTLKGRSDAVANCAVNAGMSLVWDPLGDYTQEFIEQKSTTDGSITVKRGTFKIGGGATFANLTEIDVAAGATFDLATDVSGSLSKLSALTLGANAKMKIAGTSVAPLANQGVTAVLQEGAAIETATPIVLRYLKYNGVKCEAGTYGAGATPADWATGTSTIQLLEGAEVSEERRVWTGGGDGCTWSDDANWDTRAPYSRDVAYFPGDAAITSGLELSGDTRSIEVAPNKKVTISGRIFGDKDLRKIGTGSLTISGSNSFTGTLFIDAGYVTAIGDCSLGDAATGAIDVSKRKDPTPYNLTLSNVTVRKEFILRNLHDGENSYKAVLRCLPGTTNVVAGFLRVPDSYLRMKIEANAQFVIVGGAFFNTASFFDRGANAEVVVREKPITYYVYESVYASGCMAFECAGNSIQQINVANTRGVSERIETRVDDALDAQTWFHMGCHKNTGISVLDLCGTSQRISHIEALRFEGKLAKSATVTSEAPASLAYTANKTYTNSCIYAGAVTLEQAGTGTLHLTAPSTSTGDLVVSAGTVVLEEGASWVGNYVLKGGTLRVPSPLAIPTSSHLTLSGGALDLAAGEYVVAGITDEDGNPVPPGRYAATAGDGAQALAGLAGEGAVTVFSSGGTVTVYTWTGAAGDGRFSSPANWEGNALPDFSNTMGEYRFPGNGFTVTVDADVKAKNFVFSSPLADSIRLVAADENSCVTFSDGSLVVTGAVGTTKSVVFDVPVKYARKFSIRAGDLSTTEKTEHALTFTNRLSTVGVAELQKDGYGTLTIAGDRNDILGDVVVSNGYVNLVGADPLGGEGLFRMYAPFECKNTKLRLCGTTITRPLWFTHPSDGNGDLLVTSVGATNYVKELVTCAAHHFRNTANTRSEIHYQGGLSMAAFFIPYGPNDRSGAIFIENIPAVSGSWYWSDNGSDMISCVFACEGNTFNGTWNIYNTVELRVDNAINSNQKLNFNYWNNGAKHTTGMLDLTNTRQEFAMCARGTFSTNAQGLVTWASQAKITGTSGSQLTLNGSDKVLNLPVFTDAANYVQAGTAERWFRDPCTSTGELHVVSGTLVMAAPDEAYDGRAVAAESAPLFKGGAWAGPKVRISGGTLKANHAKAFTRTVDFDFIDTTGTLEIPAGVSIPCGYIYVDGVRQDLGTYTAANFGDHISGGGSLVSQGLGLGTVLLFR